MDSKRQYEILGRVTSKRESKEQISSRTLSGIGDTFTNFSGRDESRQPVSAKSLHPRSFHKLMREAHIYAVFIGKGVLFGND